MNKYTQPPPSLRYITNKICHILLIVIGQLYIKSFFITRSSIMHHVMIIRPSCDDRSTITRIFSLPSLDKSCPPTDYFKSYRPSRTRRLRFLQNDMPNNLIYRDVKSLLLPSSYTYDVCSRTSYSPNNAMRSSPL